MSIPTRKPVAVVGKVWEQCLMIFMTTCSLVSVYTGRFAIKNCTSASTWTVFSGVSFLTLR